MFSRTDGCSGQDTQQKHLGILMIIFSITLFRNNSKSSTTLEKQYIPNSMKALCLVNWKKKGIENTKDSPPSLIKISKLQGKTSTPGTPVFPSPQRPTLPNSKSTRTRKHFVDVLPPNHYLLFIYQWHYNILSFGMWRSAVKVASWLNFWPSAHSNNKNSSKPFLDTFRRPQ